MSALAEKSPRLVSIARCSRNPISFHWLFEYLRRNLQSCSLPNISRQKCLELTTATPPFISAFGTLGPPRPLMSTILRSPYLCSSITFEYDSTGSTSVPRGSHWPLPSSFDVYFRCHRRLPTCSSYLCRCPQSLKELTVAWLRHTWLLEAVGRYRYHHQYCSINRHLRGADTSARTIHGATLDS